MQIEGVPVPGAPPEVALDRPPRDRDHFMSSDQFGIQDSRYDFPYHHLPEVTADGQIVAHRDLNWGLEYLTYMTHVRDRVLALQPESLLDVGCGDARLLLMLGTTIPRRAGVDLSARAIAFARAFDPDAEFYCCPVSDVPGQFHVVSCIETLEHVSTTEVPDFVRAMRARIIPGGRLIVSVPTVVKPLAPKHYRHYTLESLTAELTPHFRIQEQSWLFASGPISKILQRTLTNRHFVLKSASLRRLVWRSHRRISYYSDSRHGVHLVAVAEAC